MTTHVLPRGTETLGLCQGNGKRRYTRKVAKSLVKDVRRHPDPGFTIKSCYECRHCGDWHTSSMPPAPAAWRREGLCA